ncbi:MAG: FAD-dependent monooxygenase [Ignavibacteriaceae bacterium]|nr:FAD-dependent monooxygenase [Ignavibacteriaceae bacterium]
MIRNVELEIQPQKIFDRENIKTLSAAKLKISPDEITSINYLRRSIDARTKTPLYRLIVEVYINQFPVNDIDSIKYKRVRNHKKVLIVGAGPGGLYAALRLIELGIKPIVIERGKNVRERRRDLKILQQDHVVNPDSNYCFGEGGAGTYSDGKLYTRSTKRGNVSKVLKVFVKHGANPDILIDSHPHIGSNKLPKIIESIRSTIISNGGEILFNSRVTDFILKDRKVLGVVLNNQKELVGDALILATGHSARDIYYLLHKKNILLESKPFAMGFRIEHPQSLIDEIQYHSPVRTENLPAASYSLACDVGHRGVYTFCMCPGGIILPATTSPEEIVVNGMSVSKRNSPFANSGFVVSVGEREWQKYNNSFPFSGLMLQQELEHLTFSLANNSQSAPAQRVTDFVNRKFSTSLPKSSYIPGLTSVPLHEMYPDFLIKPLQQALTIFNHRMKGYLSEEAQLVAIESRTSSPIRIPRDREIYMHPEVDGFFPCGEGAGFAGGIVSSAMDGENCANACFDYLRS